MGGFPFVAAINIQTPTSRLFCAGTLLNNQWVLTSGHCANGADIFTIQLGSNFLTQTDPDRITVATSDYVIHPEFDPDGIHNDIALIRLTLPITYSSYIQPIDLPSVYLNESVVTAMGWGQKSDFDPELSEYLQNVRVQMLSNTECQLTYGNQITDEMVCVTGNFNEGACIGDTGGPLVEYLAWLSSVVGVSSFISGNGCESTDPSGYTRTYPYVDWIRSVMQLF